MSKLDAKVFSSITPFAKQWILGEETMYEFLYNYQDFLTNKFGIVDLSKLTWSYVSSDSSYRSPLATVLGKSKGISYCSNYRLVSGSQTDIGGYYIGTNNINVYANSGDTPTGYLVYELANNVKRNVFMFNKDNQSHITYYGIYGGLQTFYIDLDSTLHKTDYLLEANNDNWQPTANQDETDHSYRLQAIGEQVNPNRCYVFVTADGEAAAREIINNDPVIIYCYYK